MVQVLHLPHCDEVRMDGVPLFNNSLCIISRNCTGGGPLCVLLPSGIQNQNQNLQRLDQLCRFVACAGCNVGAGLMTNSQANALPLRPLLSGIYK